MLCRKTYSSVIILTSNISLTIYSWATISKINLLYDKKNFKRLLWTICCISLTATRWKFIFQLLEYWIQALQSTPLSPFYLVRWFTFKDVKLLLFFTFCLYIIDEVKAQYLLFSICNVAVECGFIYFCSIFDMVFRNIKYCMSGVGKEWD